MFKRFFVAREEETGKGEENVENKVPEKPVTVEEKKESVSQKAEKIGPDEIKGLSESTAHALLEETRALRADLAGGFFGKKRAGNPAPDAAKKVPERGIFEQIFSIFD